MGLSLTKIFQAGGDGITGKVTDRGLTELGLINKKKKPDGTPYTQEEITTENLFKNLTTEQQKDLLLNNPNIYTPQGSQTYNPLTNSVTLNESGYTKSQRLRQENLAAQLSGSLNGNLPSDNKELQDATFNRGKALLDPVFAQQRRDLSQQLADQGIPLGSEGYNEALNRLEQSQGKQYVDLSQASIATAEQQRQQRFNEISSLLGNAQIGGTNFGEYNPQFSGLDLFGAEQAGIERNFQASQLSKQLKAQQTQAIIGAVGSLGGAAGGAFAASDKDLKENIEFVDNQNGFNRYKFNYKSDPETRYIGVMAQEVQEIMPEAVAMSSDGYLMVNYDKIGIQMVEA